VGEIEIRKSKIEILKLKSVGLFQSVGEFKNNLVKIKALIKKNLVFLKEKY